MFDPVAEADALLSTRESAITAAARMRKRGRSEDEVRAEIAHAVSQIHERAEARPPILVDVDVTMQRLASGETSADIFSV
jgi:hypothetical protein